MTSADEEFIALENTWLGAIQRKDLAALEQILGSDYAYLASNHGRLTRQEWLDNIAAYNISSFTILSIDVRVYGDMAIVFPHYRQEAVFNGVPRSGEFLITDVWVRRDGRWQVVSRSSVRMTEGG